MKGWHLATLACCVLFGCDTGEPTQVVVELNAEPLTLARATALRVTIRDEGRVERLDQLLEQKDAEDGRLLPATVPISPLGGDAKRAFLLEATLFEGSGRFAEQRFIGTFDENKRVRVELVFSDACAELLLCGEFERCVAGVCTAATDDASLLERFRDDRCNAEEDCLAQEVCLLETGRCVLQEVVGCGVVAGSSVEDPNGCERTEDCGAEKICVVSQVRFDTELQAFSPSNRLCRPACDPCAPACADGQTCIGLAGGGGFCHPGPLFDHGEGCGAFSQLNETGSLCAEARSCLAGRVGCQDLCVPTDNAVAAESSDCDFDRLCVRYACEPGTFVGDGEACDEELGRWCRPPSYCGPTDTCTPDCSNAGECPAGVDCFVQVNPWTGGGAFPAKNGACIPDGTVPGSNRCAETRNCESDLGCIDFLGNGISFCAMPL